MNYQFKTYGDDVVLEVTESEMTKIGELKEGLPPEMRARLIGHRVVAAILPH